MIGGVRWAVIVLCGCGAGKPPGALPAGPDAGADADSDADTDSDTDSDTGTWDAPRDDDGDGHFSEESGGDDCDDADPSIHPGAGDRWAIEVLDDADGTPAVIAADAAGAIHMVRGVGGRLEHSVLGDGGESVVVDADAPVSWRPVESIAFGPDDSVDVAYCVRSGDLRVASDAGGVWAVSATDQHCDADDSPSLAFDADGAAHVAYRDSTDEDVRVATDEGGSWSVSVVDSGSPSSIAIGPDGQAHVTYTKDFVLWHATSSAEGWTLEEVDDHDASSATLLFDSADTLQVIYLAFDEIRRATLSEGGWSIENVADVGAFFNGLDATIGIDGRLRVGFGRDEDLFFAVETDAAWSVETVDPSPDISGRFPSVAVDGAGMPHIVNRHDDWAGAIDCCSSLRHTWLTLPDGIDQDCDGEAY